MLANFQWIRGKFAATTCVKIGTKIYNSEVLAFLGLSVFTKESLQIYQGFSVPSKPTKTWEKPEKHPFIVAHVYVCGDPLSRCTCRATRIPADSSESRGFSGAAALSRYTPPKGPVAPFALQMPGVLHVELPLKRCRATGGGSSYTCGCRTTLCNYAPI